MRHIGSKFIYSNQRNKELYSAYLKLLSEAKIVRKNDIYQLVVDMPCSRFWISEERARDLINLIERGKSIDDIVRGHSNYRCKSKSRTVYKEMVRDLYDVFCMIRQEYPNITYFDQICRACSHPAKRFYLTPYSAKKFILQQRRCNSIMEKLRHHASFINKRNK